MHTQFQNNAQQADSRWLPYLKRPLVHGALIIILCLAAYSNTFHVPFQFDDPRSISEVPFVRDIHQFPNPITQQRAVGFLTFALDYWFHGTDVVGYHVVNLVIHIINAFLVYAFIVLSFRTPVLERSALKKHAKLIAFFSALLFAGHPIQTQAVTYIAQRFASLATLFFLLSLVAYIRSRIPAVANPSNRRFLIWYGVSLLSAVFAMKTKETAFTLPVVIALYEFLFLEGAIRKRILLLLPLLLTMTIIPLSLLGTTKPLGDMLGDIGEVTKLQTTVSRGEYLITEFTVIATYLRLLFFPVHQNLDYDYPIFESFFTPEVVFSFLLLALILGAGVSLLYRDRRSPGAGKLAAFGIFWFFITLAVESSFLPIKDIIFEHRVYLPSVGFILAGAVLITQISGRLFSTGGRLLAVGVPIVLVALPLSVGTLVRNGVWADEVKLWDDVVQKSPGKAIGYNNRGMAYAKRGDFELALNDLDRAIDFFPKNRAEMAKWENADMAPSNMAKTYLGRGDVLIALGRTEMAREDYRMGRKMASMPVNVDDRLVLADRYAKRGAYKHALEEYNKILEWEPEHIEALNDRANAYSYLGRYQEAIRDLTRIIALDPDFVLAYHNRGIALAWIGRTDRAVTDFEHACTAGFPPACESAEIVRRGGK